MQNTVLKKKSLAPCFVKMSNFRERKILIRNSFLSRVQLSFWRSSYIAENVPNLPRNELTVRIKLLQGCRRLFYDER